VPFVSKAQQRFMFAAEERGDVKPGTAREMAHKTKSIKKLPEKVTPVGKTAAQVLKARKPAKGNQTPPLLSAFTNPASSTSTGTASGPAAGAGGGPGPGESGNGGEVGIGKAAGLLAGMEEGFGSKEAECGPEGKCGEAKCGSKDKKKAKKKAKEKVEVSKEAAEKEETHERYRGIPTTRQAVRRGAAATAVGSAGGAAGGYLTGKHTGKDRGGLAAAGAAGGLVGGAMGTGAGHLINKARRSMRDRKAAKEQPKEAAKRTAKHVAMGALKGAATDAAIAMAMQRLHGGRGQKGKAYVDAAKKAIPRGAALGAVGGAFDAHESRKRRSEMSVHASHDKEALDQHTVVDKSFGAGFTAAIEQAGSQDPELGRYVDDMNSRNFNLGRALTSMRMGRTGAFRTHE
jgi:hypothetical protein